PDMTTSPWRSPYSSACKLSVCNRSVSADDSTSHYVDYCCSSCSETKENLSTCRASKPVEPRLRHSSSVPTRVLSASFSPTGAAHWLMNNFMPTPWGVDSLQASKLELKVVKYQ
ncbi:MAG: hypothetical protein ACPIOQ_07570, partial [Promethearchaeia archaeon]